MDYDFSKVGDIIEADVKKVKDFINSFEIEIGVIDGSSSERKKSEDGLTNAELLYIHTFGSPMRHIPPRPVLDIIVDKYLEPDGEIEKTISRCIQHCLEHDYDEAWIEKQLKILCQRMQRDCRNIIYDGTILAPNAPSTIARKGSDKPLLDTGQLVRSIVARLVKKNVQ